MGFLRFRKFKSKNDAAVDKVKQEKKAKKGKGKRLPANPPRGVIASNNTASTSYSESHNLPSSVPANINIQEKERRPRPQLLRTKTAQRSTFSLLSMPSFKRGISERLENPFLWEYDNEDVYANYDVNEEIQEDTFHSNTEDHSEFSLNIGGTTSAEEAFFAANPLPGLQPMYSKRTAQRRASAPTIATDLPSPTVTDIPMGDPHYATPEVTRALVKQYISSIWNNAKLDLIPEVCSPKIRFNSGDDSFNKVGHEGLAMMVRTIHETFHGFHIEVHSMVVEGKKAFCRIRFSGQHVGTLMGYPGTGKLLAWMGSQEFTCVNGSVLKVWEMADMLSLTQQLQANALEEATEQGGNHEHQY